MRLVPDGTPPLYWAIQADDLATAQLLIRSGADVKTPNRYGITPIQIAAGSGNVAMIRALLDSGADPNTVDPANQSALMAAVRSGELEAVRVLLARGAKVDWAEPAYGQTALMFAVRESSPAIVDLLLKKRRQCSNSHAHRCDSGIPSRQSSGRRFARCWHCAEWPPGTGQSSADSGIDDATAVCGSRRPN